MVTSRSLTSSLGKVARLMSLIEISRPRESFGRVRSSMGVERSDVLPKCGLSAVNGEMLLHVSLRDDVSMGADPEGIMALVGDMFDVVGSRLLSRASSSMTKLQSCWFSVRTRAMIL